MKRPFRVPVYAYPALTLEQCEALRVLIGREVQAPTITAHHDLYVQSLGAITEAVARVREGQ